jgi:hypothetical protein
MHRSQPNRLHDELDALLDGRPVELTDELAPLAEAADALRVELATQELDPEVANRHLEQVLKGSATVVRMPTRPQPNSWDVRRRVAAVALAAALVLAPATMASAAALPGQAMYPFKLAIEQLRLAAVQWSPAREAGERTRVADERLDEVQSLLKLKMYNQLPGAIKALNRAVIAARVAVAQAQREGEPVSTVASRLNRVVAAGGQVVQKVVAATLTGTVGLSGETADAIQQAVLQSPAVQPVAPPSAPGNAPSTPSPSQTTLPNAGSDPGSAPTTAPTTPPTTKPAETPTTTAPPPPTEPPPTEPPPTEPPPTEPPPPSQDTTPPASSGADQAGAGVQAGAGDQTPVEQAPPTTLP